MTELSTSHDNKFADKFAGAIFGHAIGDAAVSGVENCGSWGFSTQQLVLTMQSLSSGETLSSLLSIYNGSVEQQPNCVPVVMRHIITQEGYVADAVGVANAVWEQSNRKFASSHALSRSVACRLTDAPISNAITYTIITHADVRCQQAAACVATIIYCAINTPDKMPHVLAHCAELCDNAEIIACLRAELTLAELETEISTRPDYITRALSCAVYATRIINFAISRGARPCIEKIATRFAAMRGLSDVNTGIVCAIIGAYVGYAAIPTKLVTSLPYHEQLQKNLGV